MGNFCAIFPIIFTFFLKCLCNDNDTEPESLADLLPDFPDFKMPEPNFCVHGKNEIYGISASDCVCDYGWTGRECDQRQCFNGGLVRDDGTCICAPGYPITYGENCEGLCFKGRVIDDSYCKCDENYFGQTCETYCYDCDKYGNKRQKSKFKFEYFAVILVAAFSCTICACIMRRRRMRRYSQASARAPVVVCLEQPGNRDTTGPASGTTAVLIESQPSPSAPPVATDDDFDLPPPSYEEAIKHSPQIERR